MHALLYAHTLCTCARIHMCSSRWYVCLSSVHTYFASTWAYPCAQVDGVTCATHAFPCAYILCTYIGIHMCSNRLHMWTTRTPGPICKLMSKRRPLSRGPSRRPPRFHHTASQHQHHPLQLPRLPLRPRRTRLYHQLHQLTRHRDIPTVLALVSSSQRLALLPMRPSLTAASCCHCLLVQCNCQAENACP